MRNRTVLAIVHRLSTIANFDRIVVLHEGRIVETARPPSCAIGAGFFDRMCRL